MGHDHSDMIWRRTAVESVLEMRSSVLSERETRSVPLESIERRTLAESIVAERDVPAHDHATMDGFAFDATDEYPLAVIADEVFPEDEPPSIDPGEAVPIATGAPLPPEANAVLKREDSSLEGDQLRGTTLEPGTYTYERGSNLSEGDRLFERGERLSPKDAILLGDLGRETVEVYEPFSTAVLATGTEIHEGRITDLDSDMLAGLIRSWGHDPTYEGSVPDEYERVEDSIDRLANQYDVVLTTGGTSVGHKDHVIRALDALGEVVFHRVRIRPGKPIAMATLPDHDAVAFAIPGKPIGAHTISTFVMRPFFTGTTSLPTVGARLTHDLELGPDGFEYVVPVTLEETEDGYETTALGHADSPLSVYDSQFDPSVLSSSTRASRADGVVLTQSPLEAETTVSVLPYSVLE
ncbi:molybdopterin molybdenumtransferase MoeA [Natrarchaeobius halalkaliphilus]|uniref:Molybdopterin molybdenumtransferase MoeA n=1 Tax=Natrarchaeobius halalkaliphilus TaxID=1679091 RepID=A0A3N6MTC2_9EURY|nr:molybdopterin molybdotransferase MoeA [Natrarchaeobius halalkaliphilus]RQG88045.1 molybdopterin molybdenumtransferase MoeA [Natrarchaeobius halalkaliphilus]